MRKRFEILSHTADLRIRVFGEDLEALFKNGVFALAFVLNPREANKTADMPLRERIELSAANRGALLVDFLSEALSRSQIKKAIYADVAIDELTDKRVLAEILGRRVPEFKEDVKAVTYHEVNIIKNKQGILETNLVLDI